MSSYKNGIVYQIYYNDDPSIHYIGSSLNDINKRWDYHRQDYNKYLNSEKKPASTIYPYFQELGIENFTIVELKKYKVTDVNHLKMYEQLHINKLKPVNRINPFNILADVDKKNYSRKHYQEHKQEKAEYGKKRYQENKEYFDNYVEENRDRIKEYKAQHYQKNKEKQLEKAKETMVCELCNTEFRKAGRARHEKSKTHIKNLEKQ